MATATDTSMTTAQPSALQVRFKETEIQRLEAIAQECNVLNMNVGHFTRAFKMAGAIRALNKLITDDMMSDIMELQGSALGFRTDKDRDNGYSVDVVKECAIDCLLRGGHLVGNEMNIIAGRAYYTKEYFTRMLAELPGLTDLRLMPGVPSQNERGALVPYHASWNYKGIPGSLICSARKLPDGTIEDDRICVKVNSGMGSDAILGKAERKIRARIFARLTGTTVSEGDIVDVSSTAPAPRKLSDLTERLAGNGSSETASQGLAPGEVPLDTEPEGEATNANTAASTAGPTLEPAIRAQLDMAATVTRCDEIAAQYPEAKDYAEVRKEQIRANRGERSKQGTLVDTKPEGTGQ